MRVIATMAYIDSPTPETNASQWNMIFAEFEDSLLRIGEPAIVGLVVIYTPLFFVSLVGNISVILVVCRTQYMRKNKNYFLMNLSIADLLVTLICVPVTLGSVVYQRWIYGGAVCKLSAFFQGKPCFCDRFYTVIWT